MGKVKFPKVLLCKCEHEEQDKMYGKYRRLHNEIPNKMDKASFYMCTVCSNKRLSFELPQ